MSDLTISTAAARRYLVARQGLLSAAGLPAPWRDTLEGCQGVMEAVNRLGAVQLDPVAVVAPNCELVMRNRVSGAGRTWLHDLLARANAFEYLANARCLLPVDRFADFYPMMVQARRNIEAHEQDLLPVMSEVIDAIEAAGPSSSRELGDDSSRLWGTGWDPPDKSSKASLAALDLLWLGGQIVVSGRPGNARCYDLTGRHLPGEVLRAARRRVEEGSSGPDPEWRRPYSCPQAGGGERPPWGATMLRLYLEAFGLAEITDHRFGWQKHRAAAKRELLAELHSRGEMIQVEVRGVRRRYYAPAGEAEVMVTAGNWEPEPAIHLLPPLDNLLWSRPRLADLWDFDYRWELYTPRARRRYGPYTMPILEGDAFIGRADLKTDRESGILRVNVLEMEDGVSLDDTRATGICAAIWDLAGFVGVDDVGVSDPERVPPEVVRTL